METRGKDLMKDPGAKLRKGTEMDDLELLRRYASDGDRGAISSVICKYQKMVFGVCLRRIGNAADAEDAMQQVFMALLHSAGRINSSVNQWLYRCAANVSAYTIRSRKNRTHREHEKARQSKAWCGNGEAERREAAAILKQCLCKLDATDQKVLIDNQVNGMTQQAIASSMGVTQQAVAKRLRKVILFLRRELTSKGVTLSLLAAVVLAVKKAASAALPEGLKAAMTTTPSASLATGGAAGCGITSVLKVGTTAMLALAAVGTYECVQQQSRASAPQVKAVAVNMESTSGRHTATGPIKANGVLYTGRSSAGAGASVNLRRALKGPPLISQASRASLLAVSSAREDNESTALRRRFDLNVNCRGQQNQVAPRSDSSRPDTSLSSSDFWGLSIGKQRLYSVAPAAETGKSVRRDVAANPSEHSSYAIGIVRHGDASSGDMISSDLTADSSIADIAGIIDAWKRLATGKSTANVASSSPHAE